MPLVDALSSHTMGANSLEMTVMSPEMFSATFSDCFMAIRLGTSSPNTSVKKDRISVIRITARVFSVAGGIVTPSPTSQSTSGSEKFSAAKALPRKPARVMAT